MPARCRSAALPERALAHSRIRTTFDAYSCSRQLDVNGSALFCPSASKRGLSHPARRHRPRALPTRLVQTRSRAVRSGITGAIFRSESDVHRMPVPPRQRRPQAAAMLPQPASSPRPIAYAVSFRVSARLARPSDWNCCSSSSPHPRMPPRRMIHSLTSFNTVQAGRLRAITMPWK
jgi:hypothetical protein